MGQIQSPENDRTITVSPDIFDNLGDATISLTIGHELVHVSDIIAAGGYIEEATIPHYRPEINARLCELRDDTNIGENFSMEYFLNAYKI
ncbi:hypothetical protein [Parahaliea mediterranea]|uniref:Uncharacterized protein n=1 Tax=Parahaliea mediterranea TaxID=651086 RepID=A0A939IN23_9GAMM|nr:hypothetical protein [Parahaliea mediterranea]MBN7797643.1 hypothetical protein [Parahaliea mediterranea]